MLWIVFTLFGGFLSMSLKIDSSLMQRFRILSNQLFPADPAAVEKGLERAIELMLNVYDYIVC